jgi:hypothetical protein
MKTPSSITSIYGQEYQPGGVGIYLVVEYFEKFWCVN